MWPRDEDRQREMIYREQLRTNELLSNLITILHPQMDEEPLKRQELMKQFAKLENKPQGWNKWDTEKIRDYLRRESA